MAWLSPGSSSGGFSVLLGTSDNLFVAAQVAISVSSSYGFDATGLGQRVVIHGTIAAANGGIIGAISTANTASWLQIGATGRLQGFTGSGFFAYGNTRIDNAGAISTFGVSGISIEDKSLLGVGSQITNSGLIEGATEGIRISSNSSSSLTVINSGTISGGTYSFFDISVDPHIDIITNTGTMIGDVLMGRGDDLFDGRNGLIDGLLAGEFGDDRLYTGAGADELYGGAGNDTLIGGAGADALYGGTEFDYASYSSATSGVVVSLATGGTGGDAAGDTFSLMGSTSTEGLIGSAFADTLTGDAAGNRIIAGAGNDTINGGAGIDTLFGQTGQDAFVFSTAPNGTTNYDRIGDYSVIDDRIRIDDAAFGGIGPVGTLTAAAFQSSASGLAADPTDRIIYNSITGALFFDADGSGAGARILMAVLSPGLALTNTEFTIF